MSQALIFEIKPKDFLETAEGLIFAVVAAGEEEGQALTFLRYVISETSGKLQKLDTNQANTYLRKSYPSYLFHSSVFDADLHGVPLDKIKKHHRPIEKLNMLMVSHPVNNSLQTTAVQLADLLIENGVSSDHLGITGSFLIGAENEKSDIDLVIYDRDVFHQAREITKDLIAQGKFSALNNDSWQDAYDRRSCSLTLEEYVWHEKRKYNKALFKGVKFDLSLVAETNESDNRIYSKKGKVTITAEVINDHNAFDTPSYYYLNHPEFDKVICFTPTYAGQAVTGDTVEISGFIEEAEDGEEQRIIVGSSREAPGEYIKVIDHQNLMS